MKSSLLANPLFLLQHSLHALNMAVKTRRLLIITDFVREQDHFCCNAGILYLGILKKLMHLRFQLLS